MGARDRWREGPFNNMAGIGADAEYIGWWRFFHRVVAIPSPDLKRKMSITGIMKNGHRILVLIDKRLPQALRGVDCSLGLDIFTLLSWLRCDIWDNPYHFYIHSLVDPGFLNLGFRNLWLLAAY